MPDDFDDAPAGGNMELIPVGRDHSLYEPQAVAQKATPHERISDAR